MFFNYLQKNVNTQKGIIPSCTKSFFTKGLLGGDNFLILLFSPNFTFFVFKKMREGTTLRVAKAARSPPCTLPFLGRRSFSFNDK